jgi:hypothetical protein
MIDGDPTTGCDHVGIHHQLGLRAILREISGRRAEAPTPVGLKNPGAEPIICGPLFQLRSEPIATSLVIFEMISPVSIAIYAFGGFMLVALAIGFFAAPV